MSGNGRQIVRLTTLLVVLNEFVDLSPDNVTLVCLLAGRDSALEQIPVHFGRRLLGAAPDRLTGLAVVQHLESDELVDIPGGQ